MLSFPPSPLAIGALPACPGWSPGFALYMELGEDRSLSPSLRAPTSPMHALCILHKNPGAGASVTAIALTRDPDLAEAMQ